MKNTSIDLSGKISETTVSILIEIEKIAVKLDFPFFVVGATARDFILEHQFDIKSSRATIDIDIGVIVSEWAQFELLKDELLSLREFSPSKQKQRLIGTLHPLLSLRTTAHIPENSVIPGVILRGILML